MASRKPRDYAAEYERRIARAAAAGKTRQAARGHKVREHVERKEKERVKFGGLTIDQIKSVERWADRRASLQPTISFFLQPDDLVSFAKKTGFENFGELRREWERQRRQYKKAPRPKGEVELDELFDGLDAGDLQVEWLYYH